LCLPSFFFYPSGASDPAADAGFAGERRPVMQRDIPLKLSTLVFVRLRNDVALHGAAALSYATPLPFQHCDVVTRVRSARRTDGAMEVPSGQAVTLCDNVNRHGHAKSPLAN
jgi:hypothetical protein